MVFLSPVSSDFIEKEFCPIIKQAKGCQLNYSLEKIKKFTFFGDEAKTKTVKNVQKRI